MLDSKPSLLLGVDGGNTKTVALVSTLEGAILGVGRAGRSDIYNTADERVALNEVHSAVTAALTMAGADAEDLAVGTFSMAGADWPEDIDLLRRAMIKFGFGQRIQIVNDALGALRAGAPDGIGAAVICGTGIAIGARNTQERIWYSGHWAVAFGGAEFGQRALLAVYEAHLGLGPPTSLTDSVISFFDATSTEEVLHRCTARGTDRHWMEQARLAPLLIQEAASGDEVACAIVREGGTRNADVALVAARAVGLDAGPFPLVLAGGVLRHPSRLLEKTIRDRVMESLPMVSVVDNSPEPVVGAVLLARDLLDARPDQAVTDRLVASLPGDWLFAT